MHKCGLCRHAASVRHVHVFCRNKHTYLQKNITSGSHTILVFPYQMLRQYCNMICPNGASNAGGVGKNYDSLPVSAFIVCCQWLDGQVLYTGPCQVGDTTPRRHLLFMADDDEVLMTRNLSVIPKTMEQHLIVRSGKSEAEVTNNKDCTHAVVLLKLTTDGH